MKKGRQTTPLAADKLQHLSFHDSGTPLQMNEIQSLNQWDGWNLKCFGRSFEIPCQRFLWTSSRKERSLEWGHFEATGSDCTCEVLKSLDHPKSSVLTGSDRRSLLEHSLPAASVLREVCCRWSTLNLAFFSLRPQRKHKIIPGPMFRNPSLEHSLPVASVLKGGDRGSLFEHHLS